MTNRYNDWQEDLSRDLIKSKNRRRLFFEGLREEYSDDLDVLRAIVKIIGLKEYATLCGLQASNISNYLKEDKDLKLSTLRKLLSPFGITQIYIPLDLAA